MQVFSFCVTDLVPEAITVEYSARFQIPGFQILGLPAPEIQEARERITSAFQASGFDFPKKKVLINLAPASIRKSGTGHDLAIALKILTETTSMQNPGTYFARGELGLDGSIRPSGRMAHLIELLVSTPRESGLILCPEDHEELIRLLEWRQENGFPNPTIKHLIRISNLRDLTTGLQSNQKYPSGVRPRPPESKQDPPSLLPLSEFHERILKIACVGGHHTLLLGPKGAGKSVSMDWFRTLAHPPQPSSAWERALYQESRNEIPDFKTPIRQVHSNVRPAHLLGSFHSGAFRAGELSLAHGGMLFADEFPEWPRDSKECLREPLQSESFQLTRVKGTLRAKCELQLIGSGNLCPCGGVPARFKSPGQSQRNSCRCSEPEVSRYLSRLSGPILDRIDLWVLFLEAPAWHDLKIRSASKIRHEVTQARTRAMKLHGVPPARIPPDRIETAFQKTPSIERILAGTNSLRERHKIIRIACSISALEEESSPRETHFLEAKTYRMLEQMV